MENQKGNKKKTYFKHFVETEDKDGNSIIVDGEKFIENPWVYDLSKIEVEKIRKKYILR